jgi:DNA-binding transcriptional regulator YiaG
MRKKIPQATLKQVAEYLGMSEITVKKWHPKRKILMKVGLARLRGEKWQ